MNKKLKLILIILLLVALNNAKAQQAISTSGVEATGSGGNVSYTIGQTVYTSISSSTGSVNQGVQQPYTILVTSVNTPRNINLTCTVYPNPTIASVNLKIEDYTIKDELSYLLYDIEGKLLIQERITNVLSNIEMHQLSSAAYILKISDRNNISLKVFTIIKNQ